ncbi:MAG: hypothetical protein ACXIUD_13360 [Mongoliitalea sp.]
MKNKTSSSLENSQQMHICFQYFKNIKISLIKRDLMPNSSGKYADINNSGIGLHLLGWLMFVTVVKDIK